MDMDKYIKSAHRCRSVPARFVCHKWKWEIKVSPPPNGCNVSLSVIKGKPVRYLHLVLFVRNPSSEIGIVVVLYLR